MYNTNIRLRLHLHKVIVLIGTARLTPPSLADELLHSKDEDTSGTADTDPKQRQAAFTISIKRNGVDLTQGKNHATILGINYRAKSEGGGRCV